MSSLSSVTLKQQTPRLTIHTLWMSSAFSLSTRSRHSPTSATGNHTTQSRHPSITHSTNIHPIRQLLWHGSRPTDWVGILSEGLKIALPEAPVTGYMVLHRLFMIFECVIFVCFCFSVEKVSILLISVQRVRTIVLLLARKTSVFFYFVMFV